MGDESTKELDLWKDHQGHQIERANVEDGIFTGYCQHCQRDVKIKGSKHEENTADSDGSETKPSGTDGQKV